MTYIPPTSCSATPATPANASAEADDSIEAFDGPPGTAQADDAQPARSISGDHPLAQLALNDLHRAVQAFAYRPQGDRGDESILLAQYTAQADGQRANGTATRLYGGQQPGGAQAPQLAAPPPAAPGVPIDLQRMEALNRAVQNFNVKGSPIPDEDLRATQRTFQAATDALRAKDYKTAQQELGKLGFPLPPLGSNQQLSTQQLITSHVLGAPTQGTSRHWNIDVHYGARGNQAVNNLNGFAANTIMIKRMSSAPAGVSNPPTEVQATSYMREFAKPTNGQPPNPRQVMQAASEITNGMLMHYSSAGARDPQYGSNPQPHAFYRDRQGQVHEFDSAAAARTAARAGKPPIERGGQITTIAARSPDQWSDITSQGTRAGRHIGDCESKVYVQTRLLTEAGFTPLGSVDVHPKGGGIGHMFGVFKAPDGSTWVTSNEEFRPVKARDPTAGVTQADLDATLRDLTADVYHIEPNFRGVRDTSDFNFSAAATVNQKGTNTATDTIRRSTELGILGRSDTLIPPPPTAIPQPSGSAPPQP